MWDAQLVLAQEGDILDNQHFNSALPWQPCCSSVAYLVSIQLLVVSFNTGL